MRIAEFPEQTVVIAKDQPQYLPLPAHIDADGLVTCCWKLSFIERLRLLVSGTVWHQIMAFHQPLQPQRLSLDKPELGGAKEGKS